jgi:heme/copper-type cytochrome/quinol oxidase subunit 2
LGIILLSSLWWIWLFLLVIGALTYFSAKSKRSAATNETEETQEKILELKKQANDLRSQLLVP